MRLSRPLLTGAALGLAVLTSACATSGPTSRFEWGSYERSLYTYAKKPEQKPAYQAALEAAVAKGRADDRVAPGLLAELGYVYLEDGDNTQAVALFKEEMQRFPESRAFLTDVVARASGPSGASR